MINVSSLHHLREFLLSPVHEAHYLLSMPALYHIYISSLPFEGALDLFKWIESVAHETINQLVVEPPLKQNSNVIQEDEWTKVFTCFSSYYLADAIFFRRGAYTASRKFVSVPSTLSSSQMQYGRSQQSEGASVASIMPSMVSRV